MKRLIFRKATELGVVVVSAANNSERREAVAETGATCEGAVGGQLRDWGNSTAEHRR